MGFVAGEYRAVSGVEQRAVFKQADGQGHGVERAAAIGQALLTGEQDLAQGVVIGLFLGLGYQAAAQGAGAAVNGDDWEGRIHGQDLRGR